jgi:hypothetical protein
VQNFTENGPIVSVASGQKSMRLVQRYSRVTQSAETTRGLRVSAYLFPCSSLNDGFLELWLTALDTLPNSFIGS